MDVTPVDVATLVATSAAERALHPRRDLTEPEWHFWERRTVNMHRVVALWRTARPFPGAREFEGVARGIVGRHFKCAWWRGLAYGVVGQVRDAAFSRADLEALVDVRDNGRGTLQWVVLLDQGSASVLGVHTWIEGYLSPVYRGVLRRLSDAGAEVTSVARGKDGLMAFLTGVDDLHTLVHTLGTKRTRFEDFRNEF